MPVVSDSEILRRHEGFYVCGITEIHRKISAYRSVHGSVHGDPTVNNGEAFPKLAIPLWTEVALLRSEVNCTDSSTIFSVGTRPPNPSISAGVKPKDLTTEKGTIDVIPGPW